jgi:pyridoxal phosphate enzyme (YggS family)
MEADMNEEFALTERVALIRKRYEHLRDRIGSVSPGISRPIKIIGVTKGFGPRVIQDAYTAGIFDIGENYAQELLSKAEIIRNLSATGQIPVGAPRAETPPVLTVHFIGQLQSNKVRSLVGIVDRYDSVDRASLVQELARRAPGARILIQVNTTEDPGKGGCDPGMVSELCDLAGELGLKVEGLMTVGPTNQGPQGAQPGFALVRSLADSLGLKECSMGMSEDLEVAVMEGATEVRIGSALFGPRQ